MGKKKRKQKKLKSAALKRVRKKMREMMPDDALSRAIRDADLALTMAIMHTPNHPLNHQPRRAPKWWAGLLGMTPDDADQFWPELIGDEA